jgi:1,4-alpha-glucan branching enzyme
VILSDKELDSLIQAHCGKPHDLLGMHPCVWKGKKGVVVRALLHDADSCEVVFLGEGKEDRHALEKIHPAGLFEGWFPAAVATTKYRLRVVRHNLEVRQFYDPYAYASTLSDQDQYLFNEGNEIRLYEKLGAHVRNVDGVPGVAFAVWAPNARRVSVVGNFNRWDGRYHPMRILNESGVWEIFIPGLGAGEKYKFEICGADGHVRLKTDPCGSYFEGHPHHAAIVWQSRYQWQDQEWMEKRRIINWANKPISVYEVHLGSWRRVVEDGNRMLTYKELALALVDYVHEMGFTHVELLPVAEYPFDGSWGYQVTGFFAPTHRFGNPDDFKFLVDAFHQKGIGVILDWVPAHFPKDSFALAEFDGTRLYEHHDPRQGYHHDWGTLIFNYGRNEVRNFLVANALSWLEHYHIDGLRVDAVASMLYLDYSRKAGEWIPNRFGGRENLEAIGFLRQTNETVHREYPGVFTVAEESTSFAGVTKSITEGGLGFDFKWNMGWMHDTLFYFSQDPVYRQHHHNHLTFAALYLYSEKFVSVLSHDEVVHGKSSMINKMPGFSMADKAAQLRSLYAFMWGFPGKKLLFMGGEFGQSREWRYDGSLDWHLLQYQDHSGIQRMIRDLNQIYSQYPELAWGDVSADGFRWINCQDQNSNLVAFLRMDAKQQNPLVIVAHLSGIQRDGYRIGVPADGEWNLVFSSANQAYGGPGTNGIESFLADPIPWNGYSHSIVCDLPASTVLFLKQKTSKRRKKDS